MIILVIILMVATKSVEDISYMHNPNDIVLPIINTGKSLTYGDIDLILNQDPSDIDYYRIRNIDGKLNVPDSTALLNNQYNFLVAPILKVNMQESEQNFDELVNNTYCCDQIINRKISDNYYAAIRFATENENYYD